MVAYQSAMGAGDLCDEAWKCWNEKFIRSYSKMGLDMASRRSGLSHDMIKGICLITGIETRYYHSRMYIMGWLPKGYIPRKAGAECNGYEVDLEHDRPSTPIQEPTEEVEVKKRKKRKNLQFILGDKVLN